MNRTDYCSGQLLLKIFLLGLFPVAAFGQSAASGSKPIYLDPSQPVAARVDDLVSRMTLEEKASQLVNQSRAVPMLGIPKYDWRSEALHGIAGPRIATVFPEPIGLAATFDAELIHRMAGAIGAEGRARHNIAVREGRRDILEGLDFWAPNINIARDPRWGRGQETYGEDPFLTGRMGVAFVTGMQGDDPKYLQVIATPKHYAVHSGPEPTRHVRNVDVSKHDLEDTYLPAFREAVMEGKAGSIMCAYNRVNGTPACASSFLMQEKLRDEWKFDGYVVGDCDSVEEIFSAHHFVKTFTEAGALSVRAGLDNECIDSYSEAVGNGDYVQFIDAVHQGLLSEAEIDRSARRLLLARFRLGEFDPPEQVRYTKFGEAEIDSDAHRALALQTARESMVLLRNDRILPLSTKLKRIAVIGPSAESRSVLLGNYSGTPSRVTTGLEGIRKSFPEAEVVFSAGMNLLREESLVPAELFTTADGKPGLRGEYFQNKEFSGPASLVRADRYIDLEAPPASEKSLAQPAGPNEFSVRWTGFLTAAESGSYVLRPTASSNRLWLDGKLVIDTSVVGSDAPKTATVTLEKGRRYALKLEAVSRDDGGATLVWLPLLPEPKERAIEAARTADVVVAFAGITSQLEGEELQVSLPGFKGGDRTSLDLPSEEEDLLKALKATGKPLVIVLMNGSALAVNWAAQNADAILEAWYPGEEGGTAIGETLAGANNPAGRLPVTFYKGVEQLPAFEEYSMKNRTYRYFTGQALYPFGYGLSYSKFRYSDVKVSSAKIEAGESLKVQADVQNASWRDGDEVVELYLKFPEFAGAPRCALRGFQRVQLKVGEKKAIEFSLDSRALSLVDEAGARVVVPGIYKVSVGGGQPDVDAASGAISAEFAVAGRTILPN